MKDTKKDFYAEAQDWAYDRYFSAKLWLNRSLFLNSALLMLLVFSVIANCFLFPLKQRVPYLYAFDKATGEVTILGDLKPQDIDHNWEMARFFLGRYVMNRESYDADNLQHPYQIAWAMSGDRVRQDYDKFIFSDNAPLKIYGKDKFIEIHVINISRLNNDTASVRFEKDLVDKNSGTKQVSNNEAIVKWVYDPKPESQVMLDRDPLGFKVTYYQVTPVSLDN